MPKNSFDLTDVASVLPGGAEVSNPASPSYALRPLSLAPAPPAPTQAPFALSDIVKVETPAAPKPQSSFSLADVSQVGPRVYTSNEVKNRPAEELIADKDFSDVDFAKQNIEAVRNDPELLQKLLTVYQARQTRGTTLKEKAVSVVKGAVPAAKAIGSGIVQAGKTAYVGTVGTPEEKIRAGVETAASV